MSNYLEQVWGLTLRDAPITLTDSTETDGWAGRGTVQSGSVTATVSTTRVQSDMLLDVTPYISSADPTTIASGGFLSANVNSMIDGVSFSVGWASGTAVSQDVEFGWKIWRVR